MLGKVLGLVTAGVFVGAAVIELMGFWTRKDPDNAPGLTGANDDETNTETNCTTA